MCVTLCVDVNRSTPQADGPREARTMSQSARQCQDLSPLPPHALLPRPTALTFGGTFSRPMQDETDPAGDPRGLHPRIWSIATGRSVSPTGPSSDLDALPTSRKVRARSTATAGHSRHVTLELVQ